MTQPIQTPGSNDGPSYKSPGQYWLVEGTNKRVLAFAKTKGDARILRAAYNAFDSAARVLGCNAVELAEVMQDGALLAEVLGNADAILYHTPHLDKEAFGKVGAVLAKMKGSAE